MATLVAPQVVLRCRQAEEWRLSLSMNNAYMMFRPGSGVVVSDTSQPR